MNSGLVSLHKIDLIFRDIFLNLIKPFYLVIGSKTLTIAYHVFDKIKKNHHEVIDVLRNDYEITFIFKSGTNDSKRKKILLLTVKNLKEAYHNELGTVADRMISFSLNDLWVKNNFPMSIIK